MFLEKGFTDYISKPLNIGELCELIKKYIPSEKIEEQTAAESGKTYSKEDKELIITFVKEKRDTIEKITGLLDSGDIAAAHRTAHNLKSAAGYVGKEKLQAAAFSLEMSLGSEKPGYSPEQLSAVERELSAALKEFEFMLEEAESKEPEAVQLSAEELTVILNELKPLLKKGDFASLSYAEKLKGAKGMEKLAEQIEDYEFAEALETIQLNNFG
jgi:HPt (histidine-containing phosphotransfer) domain-containing protein